ncbi:hypothetical protein ACS0TY_035603 [Phlomoides rotata]
MIGAITSGKIADYIGQKRAIIISSGFCTAGWLSIYFAEMYVVLRTRARTTPVHCSWTDHYQQFDDDHRRWVITVWRRSSEML